jgi:ribA/ribD-fused uncharacterized protein
MLVQRAGRGIQGTAIELSDCFATFRLLILIFIIIVISCGLKIKSRITIKIKNCVRLLISTTVGIQGEGPCQFYATFGFTGKTLAKLPDGFTPSFSGLSVKVPLDIVFDLHYISRASDRAMQRSNGKTEMNLRTMKKILFYRVNEPYGEFSNFAPYPIQLKGRRWPTSEHYFQAQKFAGTAHEEAIRLAKSPMVAARMGRNRKLPLRRDWENAKDNIMREALRAKFSQHPDLRSMLLGTAEAKLVEHTENDSYWGDGGDGRGKNRLGQLLMELRSELRQDATHSLTR